MTEEEAEEGITPEVVPTKELQVIIKDAGLDNQLANEFRINFEEHFKMASTWAKKAKTIIVTDASQKILMEEARTVRLFLRSKRLEIESFRVQKKEYYLKGGRAIDKVANFLKDTIIPIEEHLDRQEHFVELKKKAEDERLLAEAHAKMEAEALAEQARLVEEGKKIREENAKLIKEREEKERVNQEELKRVREENEKVLRIERDKNAIVEAALLRQKQDQLKKEAEEFRAKAELIKGSDANKLIKYRAGIKLLIDQFPDIKDPKLVRWAEDAKSYLWLAHSTLNQVNEIEEE